MRVRQGRRLLSFFEVLRQVSLLQWAVAVFGLGVLAVGVAGSADPYHEVRRFRGVVACERSVGDCFAREQGSIVDRDTYTTTHTDSDGNTSITTHYEVTWRRADGSRETREVSKGFYDKARPGRPVTLSLWCGEVVKAEVEGSTEWFLPSPGKRLILWLAVAYTGLGIVLWGLVAWENSSSSFFEFICYWAVSGFFLIYSVTEFLAYGWDIGFGHGVLCGVLMLIGLVVGILAFAVW